MRGTVVRIAIVVLALGLLSYRAWSVGTASELWRADDSWTVRVERVQAFMAQPSPPWAEANRVRFQVLGSNQSLAGPRVQVRVTFAEPVLNGYTQLDLTYDGRTLAPLGGRLSGAGQADLDWATARPLLEASLFPFDGLAWRQATADTVQHRVVGQEWTAYRVQRDNREYLWAEEAPWWLSFRAGNEVRAELVECSCWYRQAEALPPVEPAAETPLPATAPQAARILRYVAVLRPQGADWAIPLAERSGELVLEGGLGTGIITLTWGEPLHKMHIYVSLLDGTSPQTSLDKAVVSGPVQAAYPLNATASLSEGPATLEALIPIGKAAHTLHVTLSQME